MLPKAQNKTPPPDVRRASQHGLPEDRGVDVCTVHIEPGAVDTGRRGPGCSAMASTARTEQCSLLDYHLVTAGSTPRREATATMISLAHQNSDRRRPTVAEARWRASAS